MTNKEERSVILNRIKRARIKVNPEHQPMLVLLNSISTIEENVNHAADRIEEYEQLIKEEQDHLIHLNRSSRKFEEVLEKTYTSDQVDSFFEILKDELEKMEKDIADENGVSG